MRRAFAGQGVAECFAMSGTRLRTWHIISCQQPIGFTTAPAYARSSPSSDVASWCRPDLHVNGDDPEAVVHCAASPPNSASCFTRMCHRMFCYGARHNEPRTGLTSFMYRAIKEHPRGCFTRAARCDIRLSKRRAGDLRELTAARRGAGRGEIATSPSGPIG